jgi:DNA-binding NarL/FixJ family response regulator
MRIVIAEDSAVIRAALAELITARGHQVPAALGDGQALLCAAAEHEPDLVIIDVRMPPDFTDDGLRAALELRRARPGLPVLVFSQYVETRHVYDLLGADNGPGAAAGVGYLLKDRVADVAEFFGALDRLAAGSTVLDPEVVRELLAASRRSDALSQLTGREREVLALMAEGRSNSAIAASLVITQRAVEKHITGIFHKLRLPATDADHRRVLAVLRYLG